MQLGKEPYPVREPNSPRELPALDPPTEGYSGLVCSVAFSPDNRLLGLGRADKTARIIDFATGKELHRLEGHEAQVYSVAFSPVGSLLATGSADCTVSLWDVDTGKEHAMFEGHDSKVMSVAFTRDGKLLLSGSLDGTIRVWEMATMSERYCWTKKLTHTIEDDDRRTDDDPSDCGVMGVACSPVRSLAASVHEDGHIAVWDTDTGTQIAVFQTVARRGRGDDLELRSVAFSPDGELLAVGSDGHRIQFWSVRSCLVTGNSLESESYAKSVSFSPDGRFLAVGGIGTNGLVELWDVATRRKLQTLSDPIAAACDPISDVYAEVWTTAFSRDGRLLCVADGCRLLMWPVSSQSVGDKDLQSPRHLTFEIAQQRIAEAQQGLCLNEFETIDDEAATLVATYGGDLSLNGLTKLSDEAAEALTAHKSKLSLNGLTSLSDNAARSLIRRDAEVSLESLDVVSGLPTLSEEEKMELLYLTPINFDDPPVEPVTSAERHTEAARHLTLEAATTWLELWHFYDRGRRSLTSLKRLRLELEQYETMESEAATVLAACNGELLLNGLKDLSDEAAEALAAHRANLFLNGLTHLSVKAAAALGRHKGGEVSLDGLTTISDEVARAISRPRWGSGLSLDALTTLPVELAKALVWPDDLADHYLGDTFHRPTWHLSLNGLTQLSDDAADALARLFGDLYLNGLVSLSDSAAEAFASFHEGELSLMGLQEVSDEALSALTRRHSGQVHLPFDLQERLAPEAIESVERYEQIALAREWSFNGGDGNWPWSSLVPEAAEILSSLQMHLNLSRVKTLDTDTASLLAGDRWSCELESVWLGGLTRLSEEVAAALAGGGIYSLSLNGLKELPAEVAEALVSGSGFADRESWELYLDGVFELSVDAARALGTHMYTKEEGISCVRGRLSLDGLEELPIEVAEAITGQNLTDFSWESMSFGNLESLVVGAAKALVWHGEEEYSICEKLSLDGLEHLPDDLAEILGGHVGTLSLNGLSMLSDKAAEALAQHEGPLSLKGMCLETLTEYARQLLRKHLEN